MRAWKEGEGTLQCTASKSPAAWAAAHAMPLLHRHKGNPAECQRASFQVSGARASRRQVNQRTRRGCTETFTSVAAAPSCGQRPPWKCQFYSSGCAAFFFAVLRGPAGRVCSFVLPASAAPTTPPDRRLPPCRQFCQYCLRVRNPRECVLFCCWRKGPDDAGEAADVTRCEARTSTPARPPAAPAPANFKLAWRCREACARTRRATACMQLAPLSWPEQCAHPSAHSQAPQGTVRAPCRARRFQAVGKMALSLLLALSIATAARGQVPAGVGIPLPGAASACCCVAQHGRL